MIEEFIYINLDQSITIQKWGRIMSKGIKEALVRAGWKSTNEGNSELIVFARGNERVRYDSKTDKVYGIPYQAKR